MDIVSIRGKNQTPSFKKLFDALRIVRFIKTQCVTVFSSSRYNDRSMSWHLLFRRTPPINCCQLQTHFSWKKIMQIFTKLYNKWLLTVKISWREEIMQIFWNTYVRTSRFYSTIEERNYLHISIYTY